MFYPKYLLIKSMEKSKKILKLFYRSSWRNDNLLIEFEDKSDGVEYYIQVPLKHLTKLRKFI